jgi:hypothetical protein
MKLHFTLKSLRGNRNGFHHDDPRNTPQAVSLEEKAAASGSPFTTHNLSAAPYWLSERLLLALIDALVWIVIHTIPSLVHQAISDIKSWWHSK